MNAYLVTIARTLIGTATCVYFNAMVAYALIKEELAFRKVYVTIGIITMYFGGGMIPSYILMKQLHLIDNFLVYIIPGLSYFFNILLYMAFFREIPSSMIESAKIDGANEFYIFVRIVLPVSTAVLATIALFTGVAQWNSWYDAYIYTNKASLKTMSLLLMEMINKKSGRSDTESQGLFSPLERGAQRLAEFAEDCHDAYYHSAYHVHVPVPAEIFRKRHPHRFGQRVKTRLFRI